MRQGIDLLPLTHASLTRFASSYLFNAILCIIRGSGCDWRILRVSCSSKILRASGLVDLRRRESPVLENERLLIDDYMVRLSSNIVISRKIKALALDLFYKDLRALTFELEKDTLWSANFLPIKGGCIPAT
jgi:hypothetical protein